MSVDTDGSAGDGSGGGGGTREVAHRLFAAEFDDATLSYSESDEERAPNYVVTPTGARVNRLFAVGVLTEVEAVNEETSRGRIVDPTGAFVTYAGQYQPDEAAFLERAEPPAFVALTGKARTFEPEDSDRVFTSVRPESLNDVDAETRDRWVVSTAETTLDRLAVFVLALQSELRGETLREALSAGGATPELAAGIPKAIAEYDTSPAYVEAIRRTAVEALELVAGKREEVTRPAIAPDEPGAIGITDVGPLPETDVTIDDSAAVEDESSTADPSPEPDAVPELDGESETETELKDTATPEARTDTEAEAEGQGKEDVSQSAAADTLDDVTDDDGMYELDEEERQEIEDEYGAEFTTGTEVDAPGEADIDVPDADELAAELEADADEETTVDTSKPAADAEWAETTSADAEATDDGTDKDETADVVDSGEIDLESAVIEAIEALDDGDGAAREDVVVHVVDEFGVEPGAVGDAIQDALMGGLCYEPGDDRLKAI